MMPAQRLCLLTRLVASERGSALLFHDDIMLASAHERDVLLAGFSQDNLKTLLDALRYICLPLQPPLRAFEP